GTRDLLSFVVRSDDAGRARLFCSYTSGLAPRQPPGVAGQGWSCDFPPISTPLPPATTFRLATGDREDALPRSGAFPRHTLVPLQGSGAWSDEHLATHYLALDRDARVGALLQPRARSSALAIVRALEANLALPGPLQQEVLDTLRKTAQAHTNN